MKPPDGPLPLPARTRRMPLAPRVSPSPDAVAAISVLLQDSLWVPDLRDLYCFSLDLRLNPPHRTRARPIRRFPSPPRRTQHRTMQPYPASPQHGFDFDAQTNYSEATSQPRHDHHPSDPHHAPSFNAHEGQHSPFAYQDPAAYASSYPQAIPSLSAWYNRRPSLTLPPPIGAFPYYPQQGSQTDWHTVQQQQGVRSDSPPYRPWPTPLDERPPPHSSHDYAPPHLYLPSAEPYGPFPPADQHAAMYAPGPREAYEPPYPLPEQLRSPVLGEQNLSELSVASSRGNSPSSLSSPAFAAQGLPDGEPRGSSRDRLSPALEAKEGRYACQHCTKRFTRPSSLKIHMHSHTGERPFECANCGRSFSVQSNLKRHQKIHLTKAALDSTASSVTAGSTAPSIDSRRGSSSTT